MFYLNLDISELQDLLDIDEVADAEMQRAAANLTAATKAKITELAQEKLHSRRNMYLSALSHFQLDETTWVVNLDASARWIDDGMDPHNMIDDLLKGKGVKRAKDGSAYKVIPFQLNKGKQDMTPAQQSLLATVKKELASVGATPNGIENDSSGNPRQGLVRSLDITKAPISTAALRIGRGPRGQVAQGPTGIPLLKGVRVYQKEIEGKDGAKKMGRFVMTFRVVSSKHKQEGGRWDHPGTPPTNLMEEGLKWAMETWESKVAPAILSRIVAKLS
jgi:hypothetical protein